MPRLEITLLGSPRMALDGRHIEVDTRKAIALLAYLALEGLGKPHGREALAALFWPDVDAARAHGALRRTLSTLNRALGARWLHIDREAVSFQRDAEARLDVDEFHARLAETQGHGHAASEVCPACLAPLEAAAIIYGDDFMAGFTLRDSPAFDDWQFFQAEALRRKLAGALERLVAALTRFGPEPEAATDYARRWLALDPLHEPAHRQLMLLYAWSNQRAAALRQYRECVRVLEQELGVAPLDETTTLYEAIRENRAPPREAERGQEPAPPAPPRTGEPEAPAERWPLVGRDVEWQRLVAALAATRSDGRLIVLEGEAGIGKTRLAETFWQHARARGGRVLVARCYEGEAHLAYGPIVEGLRAALGAPAEMAAWARGVAPHWLAEAGRLLPELGGQPPEAVDSPGARGRFFEGLRQVLLQALRPAQPGGPAGVLVIDDAHWMDEASLDLLTYLVRRWRGQPLCLLVTWRAEQMPPGHRLRLLLAEALRAGAGEHLSLQRLSREAVAALAAQARPAEAAEDKALLERLYEETEGLPFFVIEYQHQLPAGGGASPAAEGRLPEEALTTAAGWSLPANVRTLLQARLARVDETGWQLLTAAAVIGRSFDYDILNAVSGRTEEETVAGLETLMDTGLVNELNGNGQAATAAGPAYDFSHDKVRALVYEETSLARRRLLHRRVAEALEARARRSGTGAGALANQIAMHFQQAGREVEAAGYYKLAGEHARGLYANAEALRHFRAALALGHPAAAALHEAIGDLLTLSGLYAQALTSYERAAALSSEAAGEPALAGLEHKLGGLYHRLGDWDLAESHYQAARNALGPERPASDHARLRADESLTAHHRGDTARALALAEEALKLAGEAGDQRALAQAHNILGILASSQGRHEAAREHLEESLRLAEMLGDPGSQAAALNNLAHAYGRQGEHAAAIRLVEQALRLAHTQGDRHREAALHNNLADRLYASGQAARAEQHVKQSVMLYAEIGAEAGAEQLQPEIWKLAEW
jgi:DNA-binding SARP family transcriptional activator/tetratricopeptide (TPR) repeat protein